MKNKKNVISILVIFIIVLALMTSNVYAEEHHNSKSFDNDVTYLDKTGNEIIITSRGAITLLAEQLELGDPEQIAEIRYVPIETNDSDALNYTDIEKDNDNDYDKTKQSREYGNNEFYIKLKGTHSAKGKLLQESVFRYPGGTMTIEQSIACTKTFNASVSAGVEAYVLESTLSAELGFSVTESVSVSNTQEVKVRKGCKRTVKAFLNEKIYDYELWEKDLYYDDYYGYGSVRKPVGVYFVVGDNVKI